jgi:hypothetical protein
VGKQITETSHTRQEMQIFNDHESSINYYYKTRYHHPFFIPSSIIIEESSTLPSTIHRKPKVQTVLPMCYVVSSGQKRKTKGAILIRVVMLRSRKKPSI